MRGSRLTRVGVVLAAVLLVAAFALPSASAADAPRKTVTINGHDAVAGEVLAKFKTPPTAEITQLTDADEHQVLDGQGLRRIHSRSKNTAALIAALKDRNDVEYVEPNYILYATDKTPNDTYYATYLWGLNNTGQTVGGQAGTSGADISAASAWDITTGSTSAVVGVIDTGVAYSHADLSANIWSAPSGFTVTVGGQTIACAAGTHGYNAIANTCDPADDNDHGTHVSGTIGATGNNGIGVVGVNWTTRIMALKFLDSKGSGTTSDAVEAIQFAIAVKNLGLANVRILSNSWGGGGYSTSLYNAIASANTAGMLFVVAAGNDGANNNTTATYPADYDVANIISVAATDNKDQLATWSNYGSTTVELGAPGVYIASTVRSGYAFMSGTSMATPHVSGAAALVLAACGNLSVAALRDAVVNNVDPVASLSGKTITGGRLNVFRAVNSCASPGSADFGLSVSPSSQTVAGTNGSASYTVTLTPTNGYAGSPTLAVSGLPAGATASVGAWSSNTATVVVTTTTSGATAGSYPLTFTATDGALTHSVTATLVVATSTATYSLSASPTSLSVKRGSRGTVTVAVTGSGGFSGTVTLAVAGLPSGVTGSFSPSSITGTGTSTLTLTAAKTAARGSFTATITGTSGLTAKTATVTVSVR